MFLSLPVAADVLTPAFESGSSLLSECEEPVMEFVCIGYVTAVFDTSKGKTWEGYRYCTPPNVTPGQLQKIVIKHLNEHPEKLHKSASSLVQEALFEAFPCPE
jgi:hypothetical protein